MNRKYNSALCRKVQPPKARRNPPLVTSSDVRRCVPFFSADGNIISRTWSSAGTTSADKCAPPPSLLVACSLATTSPNNYCCSCYLWCAAERLFETFSCFAEYRAQSTCSPTERPHRNERQLHVRAYFDYICLLFITVYTFIIKQNWNQFLLVVKATALKQ